MGDMMKLIFLFDVNWEVELLQIQGPHLKQFPLFARRDMKRHSTLHALCSHLYLS